MGPGYAIPGFAASFIFTTWAIMFASKRYGRDIWPSLDPDRQPGEFIKATLKGVSQVTFVEDWRTGIFWMGLTFSFELAPVTGRTFTNAYTTGWDPASPLFRGLHGITRVRDRRSTRHCGETAYWRDQSRSARVQSSARNDRTDELPPVKSRNFSIRDLRDGRVLSLHHAILAEFLFKMGFTHVDRAVRLHGVDIHVGSCGVRSSPSRNRLGPAVAL